MAHVTTPAAEALLEKSFPVLDHGFVRLVDYMGSDARIVAAARTSYGAGTKTAREDKKLIDYLLRHEHTSCFEQVVFTFHLKMPIFVARQLVRHRTARLNEISGRYSELADEFYLPAPERLQSQNTKNRQGSSGETLPPAEREAALAFLLDNAKGAYAGYRQLLDEGLTRELARIALPVSLYTEMYWQIDLHNLLHFLRLRLDGHAQYEIRVYAEAMAHAVQAVTPWTWESFERHMLGARRLNAEQMTRLLEILGEKAPDAIAELGLDKPPV